MSSSGSVMERFWKKVSKTDDCWNWTAATVTRGYGRFYDGARMVMAHRFLWEFTRGPIPDEMLVERICRNPRCVRPEHLHLVTHKESQENRAGAASNNQSGARGVRWNSRLNKYTAAVVHEGKRLHLGTYSNVEDAAHAATERRLDLFTNNMKDRGQK